MTAWVRAEGATSTTQLHIVLETDGKPTYRRVGVVGGSLPRARPLAQEWEEIVMDAPDLPLNSDGVMHLRFELVGPGRVWIDDVQLYNLLFPLDFHQQYTKQRFALFKIINKADDALQNGALADCQRLLDGYWPRFLEEYLPLEETADETGKTQVAEQPTAEQAEPVVNEEPKSRWSEWRRRVLRF